MILNIVRKIQSEEGGTLGKFELVDNIGNVVLSGSTLEREGPDTTTPNLNKRIPEGEYKTIEHDSPKFKTKLRLLYNEEVPKDRYILIHWGNKVQDLEGCIALGSSDNGKDFIYKSKVTVNSLLEWALGQELIVRISSQYE